MCPFGTVNWRHSDAGGIGQSAQGLAHRDTPAQIYKENIDQPYGDLTLDAHGGITGHIQHLMTGQAALRWRQVALRNDDTELKKQFDRELERHCCPKAWRRTSITFWRSISPDSNLMAMVKVTGSLGTATAKRLMLPGFSLRPAAHVPFVNEEKRLEPVDMHYADRVTDEVTYHLPPGCRRGRAAGRERLLAGPCGLRRQEQDRSRSDHHRRLARQSFTQAKPEEYQDLRGFYQKVAAAAEQATGTDHRAGRCSERQLMRRACSSSLISAGVALVLLSFWLRPAHAGMFGKDSPVPQWGLDAARTHTPDYAKDSALGDPLRRVPRNPSTAQGRATEREREAIRILQPQGARGRLCAADTT